MGDWYDPLEEEPEEPAAAEPPPSSSDGIARLFERLEEDLAKIPESAYLQHPDSPHLPAKYAEAAAALDAQDKMMILLRREGHTYDDIAREMGCSVFQARRRIHRAVQLFFPTGTREYNRAMEAARLDTVTLRLNEIIEKRGTSRDDDRAIRAVEKFIQISTRRAALLGLDEPKNVNVSSQIEHIADMPHHPLSAAARAELIHRRKMEEGAGMAWNDMDPDVTKGLPGSVAALTEYRNVIEGMVVEEIEARANEPEPDDQHDG